MKKAIVLVNFVLNSDEGFNFLIIASLCDVTNTANMVKANDKIDDNAKPPLVVVYHL